MWDRSYRWQFQVRLIAGVVVLLGVLLLAGLLSRTVAAQRTWTGARDLIADVFASSDELIQVVLPSELQTRPGTLVYHERLDGMAQVIGRVHKVQPHPSNDTIVVIRLSSKVPGLSRERGVIKGAPAELSLSEAVRLLVSPDTPNQEAILARDTIWPSVRAHLLPEIMENLIREVSQELAEPSPENAELLRRFAGNMHEAIEPLEAALVERLASRAWKIIGVQGLASGAWRATTGGATNMARGVADWWNCFMGGKEAEPSKPESLESNFLSPEQSEELRAALEEEVLNFWDEHRQQLLAAFRESVTKQRAEFDKAFTERWSTQLYQRVIEPAWQTHQSEVIGSIETYVSDFTTRRLLTRQGGPRLRFAFLLRSSLEISSAPLLILSPAATTAPGFVYQPLLP